jgi:hypothetical protein
MAQFMIKINKDQQPIVKLNVTNGFKGNGNYKKFCEAIRRLENVVKKDQKDIVLSVKEMRYFDSKKKVSNGKEGCYDPIEEEVFMN